MPLYLYQTVLSVLPVYTNCFWLYRNRRSLLPCQTSPVATGNYQMIPTTGRGHGAHLIQLVVQEKLPLVTPWQQL